MTTMRFAIGVVVKIGLALTGIAVTGGALGGCATARTNCPLGTELARRIYSGGAEAEYCHRPDGVRQGPETRYYESGAEHVTGEYVDGAQSGVWRFRFSNGRNWRAERWDDGALVGKTVDPSVARLSPEQLEALGPTSSNIIKLASVIRVSPARRASVAAARLSCATTTGGRASPATTTPTACAWVCGASGTRTASSRARSNISTASASTRRASGTRTARRPSRASTSRASARGAGAGGTGEGAERLTGEAAYSSGTRAK